MSGPEKAEVLTRVASSPLPKRKVLRELNVPKSTCYRWLNRHRLGDRPGGGPTPGNRPGPEEEQAVLTAARQSGEPGCHQLAAWLTDSKGFSVSESTVYRIPRREGLVKSPEMQLKAGKEYHRKTSRPHQMWAADVSYFGVIGWGFYYLVTVMDDCSRFILADKLQQDMPSDSFTEVAQDAVDPSAATPEVENRLESLRLSPGSPDGLENAVGCRTTALDPPVQSGRAGDHCQQSIRRKRQAVRCPLRPHGPVRPRDPRIQQVPLEQEPVVDGNEPEAMEHGSACESCGSPQPLPPIQQPPDTCSHRRLTVSDAATAS